MANESRVRRRVRAKELVANSITCSQSTSWLSGLSVEDRDYVYEVTKAFRTQPEAQLQYVASALQIELNFSASVSTIARTLQEIIRYEKKTKQT